MRLQNIDGKGLKVLLVVLFSPLSSALQAQAVSPATDSEEPVVLSPFVVSAEKDNGYMASSTLAGSRLNTELRNTPAPISVFTKDFLDDIGVQNVAEALEYSLNGTRDFTDGGRLNSTQYNDVQVKMRGFTGGSLTRNLFPVISPMDAYNTERLDFARGPNSILFGVGGPAGIIDTTTKRARLDKDITTLLFRVGSWDDYRGALDVSRRVSKKAAVRVNILDYSKENWREFVFQKRKAGAIAATFRPFQNTQIRVEGEYMDTEQENAYPFQAGDAVTPWINGGGHIATSNTSAVTGTSLSNNTLIVYDPYSMQGPVSWKGTLLSTTKTPVAPTTAQPVPISDEAILPRSVNLMGSGFTTNYHSYSYSVFLEQKIGDLSLEFAANKTSDDRMVHQTTAPGEYLLRVDANPFLPNNVTVDNKTPVGGGAANPNAGKFYVQATPGTQQLLRNNEGYRLTMAYKLDLSKKHKWLGNYMVAGLISRDKNYFFTDILTAVNVTPSGTSASPADLTAAANRVAWRSYIDLSQSDPRWRGLVNPWEHPIVNQNGVTAGFRRVTNSSSPRSVNTDAGMVALQADYYERLFITMGARRDVQDSAIGSFATQDPITKLWSLNTLDGAEVAKSGGNTTTLGSVFHVTNWLSVFYNQSNNFGAQSVYDIFGRPEGPKLGRGRDGGVRLRLLGGKVVFSADRYETSQENVNTQINPQVNNLVSISGLLWRGIGQPENSPGATYSDTTDSSGKGYEFELTANLAKGWRLSANWSIADVEQSNTYPRWGEYIATNKPIWSQYPNSPVDPSSLVPPPAGQSFATVADAIAALDATYASIRLSEGKVPLQHVRDSINLFTAYTIPKSLSWLGGITLGAGVNYRSAMVTGYDTTTADFKPVYGNNYMSINGMLNKTFRLKNKHSLKVQVNVDNILDDTDPLIVDKNNTGVYRTIYINPRRWALSMTLDY